MFFLNNKKNQIFSARTTMEYGNKGFQKMLIKMIFVPMVTIKKFLMNCNHIFGI